MIVGTRASAWRRVGWRTGNEEMKVEEMKREKQKIPARGELRRGTTNTPPGTRHPGRQSRVALDRTMIQFKGMKKGQAAEP